jgi:hypothetical protein
MLMSMMFFGECAVPQEGWRLPGQSPENGCEAAMAATSGMQKAALADPYEGQSVGETN